MYGGFNQIGRTGLLRLRATVNQALTAIRPDSRRLRSEYLPNVLNFRVDYWKSVASSSRKDPNITSKDIRDFSLALPIVKEQEAIAGALSDADALIDSLEQLLGKKRNLKQGAMQELLTGKTVALVRAYANIADELEAAGYSNADIARIKQQLDYYLNVQEIVRKASGESLDLKAYEADMRHLIDTYIEADEPRRISPFDNMSLLELIVKTGIAKAIATQLGGLKGNRSAIAETIENNVRRKIIKEHLNDPAYYEKMSALLDEIIAARKAKAIEYEEYLKRIAELAKRVEAGQAEDTPEQVNTPGRRALYNNLSKNRDLALKIDQAVKMVRPDGWRGVQAREQVIKRALYEILKDKAEVERIFLIIKQQREY